MSLLKGEAILRPLNTNLIATTRLSHCAMLRLALVLACVLLATSVGFGQTRTIRARDGSAYVGQQVTIPIQIVALGNENAIGFSIKFLISKRSIAHLKSYSPWSLLSLRTKPR